MAARYLAANFQQLGQAGRSPEIFVADIASITTSGQHVITGTLAGRRLLVARARPGRSAIAGELRALGAEVLEIPAVKAVSLKGLSPIDRALARIHEFRGIVFGCAPGVDAVLSRIPTLDLPVISVGAAAAQALSRYGHAATFLLRGACQEAIIEQSALFQSGPFLLVAAEGRRQNLHNELTKIGAKIEVVAGYRYVHRMPAFPVLPIDLVVLPSSSAARAVLSGDFGKAFGDVPMAAIGPQTEAAARQCGARSVRMAQEDSVASLVSLAVSMLEAV